MSDCITDTHGLIWYILNSRELSATAKNLFLTTANKGGNVYVPTISLVEITYLIDKNKFPVALLTRIISSLNNPDISSPTAIRQVHREVCIDSQQYFRFLRHRMIFSRPSCYNSGKINRYEN